MASLASTYSLKCRLQEPDIAGVFRRRGREFGSNSIIFGQGSSERFREAVTGDPLVQLDPARGPADRPLCLDDPNAEGCGNMDLMPKPPIVDAELACPDTPILGSNASDVDVANEVGTNAVGPPPVCAPKGIDVVWYGVPQSVSLHPPRPLPPSAFVASASVRIFMWCPRSPGLLAIRA